MIATLTEAPPIEKWELQEQGQNTPPTPSTPQKFITWEDINNLIARIRSSKNFPALISNNRSEFPRMLLRLAAAEETETETYNYVSITSKNMAMQLARAAQVECDL